MMTTEGTKKPIQIFCSYAHEDKDLYDELYMHLKGLQRNHWIDIWSDQHSSIGEKWWQGITDAISKAQIYILLISPGFYNSGSSSSSLIEVLQRHEQSKVLLIPILIRPYIWEDTSFTELNVLPRNRVPIVSWSDRDEAWSDVARDVGAIVKTKLVNSWKEEADMCYQQKQYEEALAAYDQILHLDPESLAASICKGNICLDLQRYDEALKAYEQASRGQSALGKVWGGKENPLRDRQLYEEAFRVYNRLLQKNSLHIQPTDRSSKIMLEDVPKDVLHEAAIVDINDAIHQNPINPFLYYLKGNISLGLGRYEEALGAYEQSAHLKQDFEPSHIRFSEAVENISRQKYQKLNLLARHALEKANHIRDDV